MAKATTSDRSIPNLDNATAPGLIDMIGALRIEAARLKFLEGVYKQALEARASSEALSGAAGIIGEKYVGSYRTVTQDRVDSDAVRETFKDDPEMLKRLIKTISFKQLSTSALETGEIKPAAT